LDKVQSPSTLSFVKLSSLRSGVRFARFSLAALALLAAVPACGGGSGDNAARQIGEANASLQGDWTLVDYRPEVALEPIMAQILSVQIGRLAVHFDGTAASAQGVGVQARRTYRIFESDGHRSRIMFYDDAGMPYEVTATQTGNQISFQALTAPWRGLGQLQRGAPMP
jgi:hypothetical protein